MEISRSLPARCMRCRDTGRGAPDLEMNGVKVQVQRMDLLFHPARLVGSLPQITTQILEGADSCSFGDYRTI